MKVEGSETGSLWEELAETPVAEVVVDVDAPELLPTYSYRIPPHLGSSIVVGACVHVPFGGRETLGYVLKLRMIPSSDPLNVRLRDVLAVVEGAVTFTEEQASAARWIADRYVCDLPAAVRLVAPAALGARVVTTVSLVDEAISESTLGGGPVQSHIVATLKRLGGSAELETLRKAANVSAFTGSYAALLRKGVIVEKREVSRARTVARTVRAYALGSAADSLTGRMTPAGTRILEALAEYERRSEAPVLPEKLLTAAQASAGALKTLVDKGAVEVRQISVRRAPTTVPARRSAPPPLTPGQRAATEHLAHLIEQAPVVGRQSSVVSRQPSDLQPSTFNLQPPVALLFGVTASGKTEVYLDAIGRTLDAGRSAIVLVPEIALTAQVVEVFTSRFGDAVAVLHSRLSEGERHDEWRRLQDAHARIAVGARSAVFAPVENIGLIVVDEEHEASYKQESLPRYNARDVAIERARLAGASVVLGSATPSLETYYAAEQGRIAKLEMPERIGNRPLPAVELVDMREELREHKSLFSRHLVDRLGAQLAGGKQAILFLNRRGYSQFVLCRDCGYVARCPNCAVSLAYHAAWNGLKCHHCDYGRSAPTVCPSCASVRIRGFGVGTERVEEEALKFFPSARVARLDRDTTSRKGAHSGILGAFRKGEADILIGTQMVAKGLDFPNVTLVGVISADTSINMPDFRAAERTFQLLTQVAGRAGRGVDPGEVVIQTFEPDHYSLQMAVKQDYPGFYAREIEFRRELLYPPFSRFANLICTSEESASARQVAHALAAACKATVPPDVELIGPAAAPLSKLKSLYRWHVVLRAPVDSPLSDYVRAAQAKLSVSERFRVTVDIDPLSMA